MHTSKRMHFIEEARSRAALEPWARALHTSKRMHFIEEVQATATATMIDLAYVKTYALH